MIELNDFCNDGFGWVCRHCENEFAQMHESSSEHARFMNEGEAESKNPAMANRALARWADAAQTMLFCPRCGITEPVEKS